MKPFASFIIGYHSARSDNLLQTLRFLLRESICKYSEIIIVCQDSPGEYEERIFDLIPVFKYLQFYSMELSCMQLPFVSNFGVDRSNSDRIILLESDRILPLGYFAKAIPQIEPGKCVTCTNMLKLTQTVSDSDIYHQNFLFNPEHRDLTMKKTGMRNVWSGNTGFWKEDFYKAGKMDEAYKGYGWADTDMTRTMQSIGVETIWREEVELHLWHPPATYGEGDQKQMFIDNGLYFCKKWDVPVPDWLQEEIVQQGKIFL